MYALTSEESPKNGVYSSPILAEAQQQRSYVDQQQQPVNPFVVKYSKQAMPPQHSDTAFIPCFNLCWCIHKAGQEWATGTHRSRNQSVLPSAFLHGSKPQQEMAATVFFHPFLCLCWLKPIRAGWTFQFISYRWCILTQTSNKTAPGVLSKHIEGTASQFGLLWV